MLESGHHLVLCLLHEPDHILEMVLWHSVQTLGLFSVRSRVWAHWSPAGHYYNRIWVITTGCLMWGVMTAAFSQCNSVSQGYIFWGAPPAACLHAWNRVVACQSTYVPANCLCLNSQP
jgi:hypothetical protein